MTDQEKFVADLEKNMNQVEDWLKRGLTGDRMAIAVLKTVVESLAVKCADTEAQTKTLQSVIVELELIRQSLNGIQRAIARHTEESFHMTR
jgi:hypothetical protein